MAGYVFSTRLMGRKAFLGANIALAVFSAVFYCAVRLMPEAGLPEYPAIPVFVASCVGMLAVRHPHGGVPFGMIAYLAAGAACFFPVTLPGLVAAAGMLVLLAALGTAKLPPFDGPAGGADV